MFLGAVEAAKKEGGTVVYGGKVMKTLSSVVTDFYSFPLGTSRALGKLVKGLYLPSSFFPYVKGKCMFKRMTT